VTLQTPPDLAILGDRDAFKQVLLIGLDNAIKHSSGDIEVSAELVRQGESVEIRIRDHGPGIPPEKLEQVFDRFYRGEELTTLPGYGLGLAIAKVLVEGQGGTIEMQSELGAGSVLVLRFPTSTRS
jgi:signal transduction histidine kinase